MSVSQIIIYLFLIYAITLSSKLCKIDINLSRWEEHANNVEASANVFLKKILFFFTNHERTANSSSREKEGNEWCSEDETNLAQILKGKVESRNHDVENEGNSKEETSLGEKLSRFAKSNFESSEKRWKWKTMSLRNLDVVN